jgi:hypothetical protein
MNNRELPQWFKSWQINCRSSLCYRQILKKNQGNSISIFHIFIIDFTAPCNRIRREKLFIAMEADRISTHYLIEVAVRRVSAHLK